MKKELKTFKYASMNEANSYLLINKENKKAILIDGGYQQETILAYLINYNLELTDILITHFHHDHTVGLDKLAIKTKAIIHIHEKDYPFLLDKRINGSQYGHNINFEDGSIKYDLFNDLKEIVLNNFEIQIIPKGGHSKGTTFYQVDKEHLFIGDTLFINGFGYHKKMFQNSEHPLKLMFELTCDDKIFFESIKSIGKEYFNYKLYPGHWESGFKLVDITKQEDHPYNKL
ncbi:MBL fold metallo-hydrolase [Spiroplasma monobiae]|uniref:Beta-lactamase n=1 Tax=Spiroplasma monobiae MQ-1 TaxID=1336748 RepID=A0A2K9LTU7_SPISQ|nr:MBL fold metallo-hydrolase [Spiroplasma monobiae]AUM62467.1 beta-lactamase [Spiroplasma monobiae MQ-1]